MSTVDTPKPAALSDEELARIRRSVAGLSRGGCLCVDCRYLATIDARGATIAERDKTIALLQDKMAVQERNYDVVAVALVDRTAERDALKAELATAKAQGAQEQREKDAAIVTKGYQSMATEHRLLLVERSRMILESTP